MAHAPCLKCGGEIPWRIKHNRKFVFLASRKFCLTCSPLFGKNKRSLTHLVDHIAGRRKCPRCQNAKMYSEFYVRSDGRPSVYCKGCTSKQCLERSTGLKSKAIQYKGGRCVKCGFDGPAVCFDFHHRNRSEKEFTISTMRHRKWEFVLEELDKCDLLCANCHRITEWNVSNEAD